MKRLALASAVVLVFAASANAQRHPRDSAREKRIEQALTSIAPAAVAAFRNATRALDEGDHENAVRLFREARAQAPEYTPILRRLGGLLVEQGRENEGRQLLERAVTLERSPENLITLATALAYPRAGKQGSTADRGRALDLAKEASTGDAAREDSSYLTLVAQIALSLKRTADFRDAATELANTYPDEMATHYFAAVAAVIDEDWSAAEQEVRRAERLGLPHDRAEALLASGGRQRATVWWLVRGLGYALVGWLAGLLLLFVSGKALSRATLLSIERASANDVMSESDRSLRKKYRMLVSAAAAYYYVSLPFVALLVVGGASGLIYGFLALGRLPIKLVMLVVFGAIVTVYKMVQSLFLRVESADPGRRLEEAEAPKLWAMAREVADKVGTRPIDEIRVTPGTELAVYERGSAGSRARDEAHRVLILGVGVLNDFRLSAFRAVLAHEYGHFSHRDTAGGDVALRVRQHIMQFAVAMAQHGQAVAWNAAFQFLRCYDFLFRRISHGATRLQEVLADRVAAQQYGAEAFEEGLRHVIRRSIEFESAAGQEIAAAVETARACRNLYELPAPADQRLEDRLTEVLGRTTTEDDTHPAPLDRFRFVRGVTSAARPADGGFLWELFVNRERLTAEMTAQIESRVRAVPLQAT